MGRLSSCLTQDQRNFLREIDIAVKNWPNGEPKNLHLRPRHYKIWQLCCKKKLEFPEANGDLEIDGDKYRGVKIVKIL